MRRYKRKLLGDKFLKHVKKTSKCWEWIGAKVPTKHKLNKFKSNYGHLRHNYKYIYAHRVSWMIHNGPIPNGKCILHKCDNPICVNPSHLRLGTRSDNAQDRERKNRGNRGIGENSPVSKLTNKDIKFIRNNYIPRKITAPMLAKKYKVSTHAIYMIVGNRSWKHLKNSV